MNPLKKFIRKFQGKDVYVLHVGSTGLPAYLPKGIGSLQKENSNKDN